MTTQSGVKKLARTVGEGGMWLGAAFGAMDAFRLAAGDPTAAVPLAVDAAMFVTGAVGRMLSSERKPEPA